MVDANIGYLSVNSSGQPIFKTTNGGTNWFSVTTPLTGNIKSVRAIDANTVYIGAGFGTVRMAKTTNGGTNWTPVTLPVSFNVSSIDFMDADTGYVTGNTTTVVCRTTNGGSSWTFENLHLPTLVGPLNGSVGPPRKFDWLKMPLDEVKAIRRALDCTVNDFVLAVVTGAVRNYFLHRAVDPSSVKFRVSSPVSVRGEDQKGKLGNNVSSWIIELPIHEPDPRQQLGLIHEETVRLKETRQALGVQTINKIAEFTPSVLLSLGARANEGQINTIVTNVPGPQLPLYFRGARALEMYPQVPLMEGLGIGIALASYDGTLHWGFNSDPDIVPDADVFVEKVQEAYEAVAKEAGVERKERFRC